MKKVFAYSVPIKVKQENHIERLQDYLKNVWTVRMFFMEKYGVDPPNLNADQMPLLRN